MVIDVIKVILPAAIAFFIGIGITPIVAHYLYAYKAWKKRPGKVGYGGGETPLFNELHKYKDTGTPRMGGIVIWGSSFLTIALFWIFGQIFSEGNFSKLDFLSRSQTWLPFTALMIGSLVGLIDDLYEVSGRGSYFAGGLPLKVRLLVVGAVALFAGWWFFEKLDIVALNIPFGGELFLGPLMIPFVILVALALYASGVIDGIDGLSGGVFATIFGAYALLAFFQNQIDLAAFSAMLVGSILAFLWFNIPPARFYMTETGVMGLTLTLVVIAFMTDSLGDGHGVFVLPIIGFLLVVTVLSDIIQVTSKRFRGKKVFRIAPLHHHFEAIGWPGYKVTMRYWVIGIIFALIGLIVGLLG